MRGKRNVVFVAGPSGAGKSSLACAIGGRYQTYIEDPAENNYLEALLNDHSKNNAFLNQQWFLRRMEAFISLADPELPLLIDQHPLAISEVYATFFKNANLMSAQQQEIITNEAVSLMRYLKKWRNGHFTIFLDADISVLQSRLILRNSNHFPSLHWLSHVQSGFAEITQKVGDFTQIDTTSMSRSEVEATAIDALKKRGLTPD
jgi:deoxyadenosine/deoxycytidine kinase